MSCLFQWIFRKFFGRRGAEPAGERVEAAGTFSEEGSPSTPCVPDYLLAVASPESETPPEASLSGYLFSVTSPEIPESETPSEGSVVGLLPDSAESEVSHLSQSPEAGTPCIPLRYLEPADTSSNEEECELRQIDLYLLEESDRIDRHRRELFLSGMSSLRLLLKASLFD